MHKPGLTILVLLPVMTAAVLAAGRASGPRADKTPASDYPVKPVPFTDVKLTDAFWAPRLETNRVKSIPYAFHMNETTGRVDNFRKAAGLMTGPYKGKRYNDSDIYKSMEAAAYSLRLTRDPELERKMDDLVELIGKAQEPDGYLFTARTVDPAHPAPGAGAERWSNLRVSHELYVVGHMYEAAVAYYQATGKRAFLDIALKNADFLLKTFGPGLRHGFPGHQEVEIGLAKLYRVTGDRRYLELAKFFLDERGHYHEGTVYAASDPFAIYNSEEYMQNHKPVLEQDEAVGHAVRAMYMFSGMADVAALGGYPEYIAAIDRLWDNVVGKKLYLTGGVGARGGYESFGDAYELPNASAYAETCAAVGNALWNQRLFLLHADAKYVDVFERVLYNGLLSGVSLSGDRFFYQNPLASGGDYGRSPWFEVACCPPNITRFLPSLPGYIYAVKGDTVYMNLFIAGEGRVDMNGRRLTLKQETRYPWDGQVRITVGLDKPAAFKTAVRIPGWARNQAVPGDLYAFLDKSDAGPVLRLNGKALAVMLDSGYAMLDREWRDGDMIELDLPMPVRRVVAHQSVAADKGRVALQRGPIVYCLEGNDNGGRVLNAVIPDGASFTAEFRPDLLGGVAVVAGEGLSVAAAKDGGKPATVKCRLTAIPYYAWANRARTEMTVWTARTPEAIMKIGKVDRSID